MGPLVRLRPLPVLLLVVALASGCASPSGRAAGSGDQPVFRPAAPGAMAGATGRGGGPSDPASPAAHPSGTAKGAASSASHHGPAAPTATGASSPATALATPYRFAPSARSSGPTPDVVVSLADLVTSPNAVITVKLQIDRPGAAYLNSYAATAGFPVSAVRACLRQQDGPRCVPTAVPDPGYWPVTAADLQHSKHFELVVAVAQSTTSLLGLHLGWDGAHEIVAGGLRLPAGCTITTGYKPGCGVRAHLVLGAGGPVTVATVTTGLHATVKDKTSGAKLASQTLRGSLTTTLPASHEWALHLFPDGGSTVASLSLSLVWP